MVCDGQPTSSPKTLACGQTPRVSFSITLGGRHLGRPRRCLPAFAALSVHVQEGQTSPTCNLLKSRAAVLDPGDVSSLSVSVLAGASAEHVFPRVVCPAQDSSHDFRYQHILAMISLGEERDKAPAFLLFVNQTQAASFSTTGTS